MTLLLGPLTTGSSAPIVALVDDLLPLRRHLYEQAVLAGLAALAAVFAATVSPLFLPLAALLATGTYAAWQGVTVARWLDLVDDSTAPPTWGV